VIRRTLLALALGAAPLSAQSADTAARPIRLADAITMAVAAAPANVASRGAIETGNAGVISAYAAFIPSVTLSMSTSASSPATARVNPTTGQLVAGKWNTTGAFSLGVDIFDGGRRLYSVASARALLGASEAADVAQRYQTAYNVKVQFYAVLASREQQIAAKAAYDAAVQQMKASVAKAIAHTVTKSDTLQSLVAVGNARLQLLQADLALQTANATLTRLVASPVTITASLADSAGDSGAAIDSATVAQLAQDGPSVRQANASLDAAVAQSKGARSTYFPSLSVTYGRNFSRTDSLFTVGPGVGDYSGQLRFTMSYPLFNQWQRESGIVAADVARLSAEANARDAKYAVQESLVQDLGALRTAEEQTAIQLVSVAAAEENLRVQQERYALGVSTILDVLTAQSTVNSARVLLIQARFNARVAKAQLEALIGRDL